MSNIQFRLINSILAGQVTDQGAAEPLFNAQELQSRPLSLGPVADGDGIIFNLSSGNWIYGPGGGGGTGPTGPCCTGPTGPPGTGPTGPAGTGHTGPAGPLVYPLTGPNGSAAAPTYSFINNSNSGLYVIPSGHTIIAVNGANKLTSRVTSVDPQVPLQVPVGSAAIPTYAFVPPDDDTGMFRPASDTIGFTAGGTLGMRMGNGTMGFYGTAPIAQITTATGAAAYASVGGSAVSSDDTFGGYSIGQIVTALQAYGLLA